MTQRKEELYKTATVNNYPFGTDFFIGQIVAVKFHHSNDLGDFYVVGKTREEADKDRGNVWNANRLTDFVL